MKTLTLILLVVSSCCGQTESQPPVEHIIHLNPTFNGINSNTVNPLVPTYICLHIAPSGAKSMSDVKRYFLNETFVTEDTYDCCIAARTSKPSPAFKGKFIEVRITLNGINTDLTFAEFKKLMWP